MDNIAASVAAWGPDRLDVFGVGGDGSLYHKAWTGAAWSPGWEDLGGQFTSAPAVAAWGPDRLDVFGVGGDKALYHKAWEGSVWEAAWDNLGGQFIVPCPIKPAPAQPAMQLLLAMSQPSTPGH